MWFHKAVRFHKAVWFHKAVCIAVWFVVSQGTADPSKVMSIKMDNGRGHELGSELHYPSKCSERVICGKSVRLPGCVIP